MAFVIIQTKQNELPSFHNKAEWILNKDGYLDNILQEEDNLYLLGKENEAVVSILAYRIDRISISLLYITTKEGFKRRGYATKLVDFLKSMYINKLSITGWPLNDEAMCAMKKWGFKEKKISIKGNSFWEIPCQKDEKAD
jgi:ribosomal protein S18 acetylase RimI-like enzyme